MLNRLVILAVLIFPLSSAAQKGLWQPLELMPLSQGQEPWVQPAGAPLFVFDETMVQTVLQNVAMEASSLAARQSPQEITLPTPDGEMARFHIVETEVMHPDLAAQFPEIRTFRGVGVDDPLALLRMDLTPKGFHAQVLSPSGSYYIDPYWKNDTTVYSSYRKNQLSPKSVTCGFDSGVHRLVTAASSAEPEENAPTLTTGATLKTYRLAVTAQGEYTAFHGGTTAGALAAIATTINRVNGIYERDLAVRLQLVASNNFLIFLNPATDPFPVNDATSAMLSQNQTTTDSRIGVVSYDVGHLMNTGGGGLASLGVVCFNPQKAEGITGTANPMGDAFDIDFVAHEMGHQFGADHSFNGILGNCSGTGNASTAYEPGGGSTIMAYAGICDDDDLQAHSSDYFHATSLEEINTYLNSKSCEVGTATGNSPPSVSAGANYTIPKQTPFTLTASASDTNGDTITYCWEEMDLGPFQALSAVDNGSSPLFRSFPPTTNPSRTLPQLITILSNTNDLAEELPNQARTMTWRVTARDNRLGGGGTDSDETSITVNNIAGPFLVTSPNTAVSVSESMNVTWNRANTHVTPVSTPWVNIRLSADGGYTYPYLLAGNADNDGAETVSLPSLSTTQARIKVEGAGNIFFDVSNADFTITPSTNLPLFIDAGSSVIDDSVGNGNGNGGMDPGESSVRLFLVVENDSANAASGVSGVLTSLTATASVTGNTSAFPDVAAGATATNSSAFVVSLDDLHPCGADVEFVLEMRSAQSTNFVTMTLPSGVIAAPAVLSYSVSVSVADNSTEDIPFAIGSTGTIADVDFKFDGTFSTTDPNTTFVGLNHSYVGDLVVTLISPTGTDVVLMNQPGGGAFGSSGNNFYQTRLDDDGAFPSIQSIDVGGADAPHAGTWLPANPLSAFDGEEANGIWTLRVWDTASPDSGRVNSFSLILTLAGCEAPASNVVYTITATSGANGVIQPNGPVSVDMGSDTNFLIMADAYYHIDDLLTNGAAVGGIAAATSSYSFVWSNVVADGTVDVSFAENLATNETPEWWLAMFGLTNGGFDAAALADTDGDGVPAWEEHKAGTIPTNGSSFLQVDIETDEVISWRSESNKLYTLRYGLNPETSPAVTVPNIPATPPVNTYTNTGAVLPTGFYRIDVQP